MEGERFCVFSVGRWFWPSREVSQQDRVRKSLLRAGSAFHIRWPFSLAKSHFLWALSAPVHTLSSLACPRVTHVWATWCYLTDHPKTSSMKHFCCAPGSCGSGIWMENSGRGLSLLHDIPDRRWKTRDLGLELSAGPFTQAWQWTLAVCWVPSSLRLWSGVGFSVTERHALTERYFFYDLHCFPHAPLVTVQSQRRLIQGEGT